MSDPYIRLWQAVIQQQFADMANCNKKEDAEIGVTVQLVLKPPVWSRNKISYLADIVVD